MKRIESKEDMIKWANNVNSVCKPKQISDLQDIFARSAIKDLKKFFINMEQNEKELLVFSISKAMGSSLLFEFIKDYSNYKAQQFIESESKDNDERWASIVKKEMDFETDKKKYQITIANSKRQIESMEKNNDRMSNTITSQYNRIIDLEKESEELSEENTKLMAFESHIKSLLNK